MEYTDKEANILMIRASKFIDYFRSHLRRKSEGSSSIDTVVNLHEAEAQEIPEFWKTEIRREREFVRNRTNTHGPGEEPVLVLAGDGASWIVRKVAGPDGKTWFETKERHFSITADGFVEVENAFAKETWDESLFEKVSKRLLEHLILTSISSEFQRLFELVLAASWLRLVPLDRGNLCAGFSISRVPLAIRSNVIVVDMGIFMSSRGHLHWWLSTRIDSEGLVKLGNACLKARKKNEEHVSEEYWEIVSSRTGKPIASSAADVVTTPQKDVSAASESSVGDIIGGDLLKFVYGNEEQKPNI